MKEPNEKNWWDDKTIQIPKGLLIKGVSGEAVAVYAKMKGFGVDVRCSLAALSQRLGWTDVKTRKHQNELREKGWIVLLAEGHGGGKTGSKAEPRIWYMCANAGEQVPQELLSRVSKFDTLESKGIENQGSRNSIPKTNKEVLQTNKRESEGASAPPASKAEFDPKTAKRQARQARLALLDAHAVWWMARFSKPSCPAGPGDDALADKMVTAGVTEEAAKEALRAWPANADTYTQDQGFTFRLFAQQFNRLQLKSGAPTCTHEKIKWGTPFRDGTQVGRCETCGRRVHRAAASLIYQEGL